MVFVEKKMDDLGSIFSPKHHYWENIGISIWKLNKVHDMDIKSVSDKENKKKWFIIN